MFENNTSGMKPEGLERLDVLWSTFDSMKAALSDLGEVGGHSIQAQTSRLADKIDAFEPAVSLIGQVKAGKTALINSMIGHPGFLPSDVNPWTSVVTSLHLNARTRPKDTQALFRFFDEEEWDRLVSTGGRLGELAQRAGFEDEHDEIRQQINQMREKSKSRLGNRFEMLLGSSHRYDELNSDLIDRYVCHGGWEDDEDQQGSRGRFADITKIADLYLDLNGYPTGLCLRDTPGVNDTFMMREQITINAIRDSRLCVAVLSAHQALSTMDMALLRLIANIDARDVVLFVNRIDELDDPASQVPEIAESFRHTLKKHRIAEDTDILFGSASWALNAHGDTVDDLPATSWEALQNWGTSDSEFRHSQFGASPRDLAWSASGVPALHKWIADRIVDGSGRAMLHEVRDEFANIVTGVEASAQELGLAFVKRDAADISPDYVEECLNEIQMKSLAALDAANKKCVDSLKTKLAKSQDVFAERAIEALGSHLELHKDSEVWEYDPSGLRMMLRSAYRTFGDSVKSATDVAFSDACHDLEKLYEDVLGFPSGGVRINPPATAKLVPPAVVGQTIALDLNTSWWGNWLRTFRKKSAVAQKYRDLIVSETDPIVNELTDNLAASHVHENAESLKLFLDDQKKSVVDLLARAATQEPDEALSEKARIIQDSRQIIDGLAA